MMEDETWLTQQGGLWRDAQGAMSEEVARSLSAELIARHRRDAAQRRLAHLVLLATGLFLGVIAAPLLWLRDQPLFAALSLLHVPLGAYAAVRMEQGWRAKQDALAYPPAQVVRALGEQLSARELETRWGQLVIKIALVFTSALGVAIWWYAPRPLMLVVCAALLIKAALAYLLHVHAPRALLDERARYEALLAQLSERPLEP